MFRIAFHSKLNIKKFNLKLCNEMLHEFRILIRFSELWHRFLFDEEMQLIILLILQDYLGGVIVFASIVTALFTAKLYPQAASPSLVALAINYTLLVPIYLNWVVKLLSDMEMYIGAVERIEMYINPNDKSTGDNDIDESPCELMAMKTEEKCECNVR